MKTAFAIVAGLAAGVLAAGAPVANSLVLLLGLVIGVALALLVIAEREQRRRDDEFLASLAPLRRPNRKGA